MARKRNRTRHFATVLAFIAGVVGISLATATSASAQIYGPQSCVGSYMDIVGPSGAYQCFTWDGVQGGGRGGSYLLVNDWYRRVDSNIYKLTVSWHDTVTGSWYTVPLGHGGTANQPTSNSILYSITFNS